MGKYGAFGKAAGRTIRRTPKRGPQGLPGPRQSGPRRPVRAPAPAPRPAQRGPQGLPGTTRPSKANVQARARKVHQQRLVAHRERVKAKQVRERTRKATRGPTSPVQSIGERTGRAVRKKATPSGVFKGSFAQQAARQAHDPVGAKKARLAAAAVGRRAAIKSQRPILPAFPTLKSYTPEQAQTIRAAKDRVAAAVYDHGGVRKFDKIPRKTDDPGVNRYLQQTHSERTLAAYRRAGAFKVKDKSGRLVKPSDPAHWGQHLEVAGDDTRPIRAAAPKILRVAGAPNNAIAGAAHAALSGENPIKGAKEGIKHQTTFSDVLGKDLGVHNKILRYGGGFIADVALDPTTYLSMGTNVPTKAATKAGQRAERRALQRGLSHAQAQKFKQMATRQASKDDTRGITLGLKARVPFTDHALDVKTSGSGTARIGRKVKATKVGQKAAKGNRVVRDVLNETVAPDVTPSFRTRAEHEAIRDAERTKRAATASGERRAVRRQKAYSKAVNEEEASQIRRAIELKQTDRLPKRLKLVAQHYEQDFKQELAAKTRRGLGMSFAPEGPKDAQAYFARAGKTERKDMEMGRPSRKPAADRRRKVRLPFDEAAQATKPGTYVEDARAAAAVKQVKTERSVALHDFWQHVRDSGGRSLARHNMNLKDGEAVYEVVPRKGPRVAAEADETQKIAHLADLNDGRYIIWNKKSIDNVLARQPSRGTHIVTRAFDRAQGTVKKFQTVYRPGYHPINLIGDSFNAYLHDTGAKSFGQSRKALKAQAAQHAYERSAEAVTVPGKKAAKARKLLDQKVHVGKAGKMTLGDLVHLADTHGAINTGQVAAEVKQLEGGAATKAGQKEHKFSEWRENIPRLATFREGLARGMTPEQAAKHSLKAHIDYADLSPFERKYLRRAFQFYTFFARNSRIQARQLLTRPGKYATVQKALEESAKAAGFGNYSDFISELPDYNQRGLPVPARVGRQVFPVFLQLPATDLGSLSLSPQGQFQNIAGRLSTFKTIPELVTNYSIFFQGPIRDDNRPSVPAPTWAGDLPGFVKKRLGVKKIQDKRSGKMIWGWDAKADYTFRALPQTNLVAGTMKPVADDRGLNRAFSVGAFVTGVKVGPDKRKDYAVNRVFDDIQKLKARRDALNQQGVYIDRPVPKESRHLIPEYKRVNQRLKDLQKKVEKLKAQRGDKPPAKKSKGSSNGGWGGSSGGSSGGASSNGGWGGSSGSSSSSGGW